MPPTRSDRNGPMNIYLIGIGGGPRSRTRATPSTEAFYKSHFPAPFKPDTTDTATMFHTWLAPEIFSLWLRLFGGGISRHVRVYVYETQSDAMGRKISVTLEKWKNCPSDDVKLGNSRTASCWPSREEACWRFVGATSIWTFRFATKEEIYLVDNVGTLGDEKRNLSANFTKT